MTRMNVKGTGKILPRARTHVCTVFHLHKTLANTHSSTVSEHRGVVIWGQLQKGNSKIWVVMGMFLTAVTDSWVHTYAKA